MHFTLVLPILSFMFGATKAGEDYCQWAVMLCNLGDPATSSTVCHFDSPRQTHSGGIEKQELNNKVHSIIKSLIDQPVDTENIDYYGFPYYLRIDLDCWSKEESRKAMQEALFTGLTPSVNLIIQEPVHPSRLKPQRLDITMSPGILHDNDQCDSDFCPFGWYTPMPFLNGSVVYRIKVMSNGQGMDVPEKSFAVNVNGFMETTEWAEPGIAFGTKVAFEVMMNGFQSSAPIWATSERAPVMVLGKIPGFKAILLTSTEFDHSTLVEKVHPHPGTVIEFRKVCEDHGPVMYFALSACIQGPLDKVGIKSCWVGSLRCPQLEFDPMIQEVIATESTLFIRQNRIVHRFIGNYSLLPLQAGSSDAWEQVLRSVCVSKIMPVDTPNGGSELFYVTGDGADMGTTYRADIQDGEVTFSELRNSRGESACQFMTLHRDMSLYEYCKVHGVTNMLDEDKTNIVLIELSIDHFAWEYHVVIHDKEFQERGLLPQWVPKESGTSFIVVDFSAPDSLALVIVHGIVYNPTSSILYFWGSCLIISLDEGHNFLFVRGIPLLKQIKYFSLSYHGEYAFVTNDEQVFWGKEGTDTVQQLRVSLGWRLFSSLQLLKGDFSYDAEYPLLTVFWDSNKQLQEVIYIVLNNIGHVVKREIPVAEISKYNAFAATASFAALYFDEYSTFNAPNPCPFYWETFENLPQPEPYNRIQHYLTRPPLVTISSGLHSVASLATYQSLLSHLLKLHSEYIQDIGDPAQNPISRLWADKMVYEDYFFYMASNGVSSSGFNVEMDGYSRIYENPDITFPDKVYLDLGGSFSFSLYINTGSPNEDSRAAIEHTWLSSEVSDDRFVYVAVVRHEFYNRAAILHEVTISDRGAFPGQSLAGEGLLPFTVVLKVSDSDMKCFQQTNLGIISQGLNRLTVYIGCPPGKRLALDITKTLEECTRLNKRYFNCPYPASDIPCFYYEDLFYPFFLIQDMVSGESGPFLGSYTFNVVGGGAYSRNNIRYYSPEEVLMYNSNNHSSTKTLMWTYEDLPGAVNRTKEGFAVLSGATNKIRWICQRNSPCGDLVAQGLMAPDFYFVIEVSNKGVDMSTYCDYALRFVIQVHGFPLDPSRALYYMLMTLATIVSLFFCYIVFHCFGPGVKKLGKAAYEAAFSRPKMEQESDISVGEMMHLRARR